MTTTVTMTVDRMGESGTIWESGQSYSATDDFAKWLVARNFATADFETPASYGWDDEKFPAQAINPAGAVAAPTVDTTLTGFPGTLLFSGSAENVIAGICQFSHQWDRGPVRPHVHWSKPTGSADAVSWRFYWRNLKFAGQAPGAWSDAITGTLVAGDQTTSDEHLITSFGEIDLGDVRESSIINWRVHRLGDADADNNAVRLLEFDIHFIRNKAGTEYEIPEA